MGYADNTSVSVEKSKAEIERTPRRYGAEKFMSGWTDQEAVVQFECQGRVVKFRLTLPHKGDKRFKRTPAGRRANSPSQALAAWEQACRQKWRALNLVIKAKLEAIDSGITTFDEEFLPFLVLPGRRGATVGDELMPRLVEAYGAGKPLMLPDLKST